MRTQYEHGEWPPGPKLHAAIIFLRKRGIKFVLHGNEHALGDAVVTDEGVFALAKSEGWRA